MHRKVERCELYRGKNCPLQQDPGFGPGTGQGQADGLEHEDQARVRQAHMDEKGKV